MTKERTIHSSVHRAEILFRDLRMQHDYNLPFSHVNLNTIQSTRSNVIWKSTGIVHRARNYRDRRGIDKRVRAASFAEARN